jgi:hypothetical protein
VVAPLINHHRSSGEGLDDLESLDAVEKGSDAISDGLITLIGFLTLANTIGAVFCKERHNAIEIMAGPGSTKVVDDLDIYLFGWWLFRGIGSSGAPIAGARSSQVVVSEDRRVIPLECKDLLDFKYPPFRKQVTRRVSGRDVPRFRSSLRLGRRRKQS